jgi:hypothetical protein
VTFPDAFRLTAGHGMTFTEEAAQNLVGQVVTVTDGEGGQAIGRARIVGAMLADDGRAVLIQLERGEA